MVVYIEVIMLINFIFDFCILLTTDITLKRHTKFKKLIISSLFGELSMLTLIIHLHGISQIIFKVFLSIILSFIAFGYKDIKYSLYNVVHLYFIGIILGGFITFLYNEFSINREYSLKYVIILFLCPIVLYIYYRITKQFKTNYNNRYKVIIDYPYGHYEGVGYLDSGNKLISPFSNKPIILVEKEYIEYHKLKLLPVPYHALNHNGLVNCFKPDKLIINDKEYSDILVGLSDDKFNIEGISILLNARMEGLWYLNGLSLGLKRNILIASL